MWVLCWWKSVLVHWYRLSISYAINDNRLRLRERVKWITILIASTFIRGLLIEIINFPSLSYENSYYHLHQKVCTILTNLPAVFEIVFITSGTLYSTVVLILCSITLHCNISAVLQIAFRRWNIIFSLRVGKTVRQHLFKIFLCKRDIFQYIWNVSSKTRLCPELTLAADNDNTNLILIWPHCHFQQKKRAGAVLANKTPVTEVLKMRYWYSIEFVCGYIVPDILPSNFFVEYRFKYRYLKMHYRYTANQFLCSCSTSRKEIIVKLENSVHQIYLSKHNSVGMSSEL